MPNLESNQPIDGDPARQGFVDVAAIHSDEPAPTAETFEAALGEPSEAYKKPARLERLLVELGMKAAKFFDADFAI